MREQCGGQESTKSAISFCCYLYRVGDETRFNLIKLTYVLSTSGSTTHERRACIECAYRLACSRGVLQDFQSYGKILFEKELLWGAVFAGFVIPTTTDLLGILIARAKASREREAEKKIIFYNLVLFVELRIK